MGQHLSKLLKTGVFYKLKPDQYGEFPKLTTRFDAHIRQVTGLYLDADEEIRVYTRASELGEDGKPIGFKPDECSFVYKTLSQNTKGAMKFFITEGLFTEEKLSQAAADEKYAPKPIKVEGNPSWETESILLSSYRTAKPLLWERISFRVRNDILYVLDESNWIPTDATALVRKHVRVRGLIRDKGRLKAVLAGGAAMDEAEANLEDLSINVWYRVLEAFRDKQFKEQPLKK